MSGEEERFRLGDVEMAQTHTMEYLDGLNNNVADLRRHLAGLQQREWELLRNRNQTSDPQARAEIEAGLTSVRAERDEYRALLAASRDNLDSAIGEYLVDNDGERKYTVKASSSHDYRPAATTDQSANAQVVVIDQHDSDDHHPTGRQLWLNSFVIMLLGWQAVMIILYYIFIDYSIYTSVNQDISYYKFFQDVSFMLLFGFGFLMAFLRKFGFSAVGLTFLITVVCVEWAVLTLALAKHVGGAYPSIAGPSAPVNLVNLIDADFAAAAVLISFGGVIGKTTPSQLLFMSFWEIILYSVNFYINFFVIKGLDIGGSMVIHTFGAFFGLSASYFLSPVAAKEHPEKTSLYNSDIFAMIGTLFLWLFWPSFNAALAPALTQARVIINTFLGLIASTVAAFLATYILRGHAKFDMVDIQNATLAGGVAMGSSADLLIQPGGALLLGFVAGALATLGFAYASPFLERKFGLQDTCGIFNLHGMSGILGGLASIVATASATNAKYGLDLATYWPHGHHQAPYQLYVLLISLAIAIVGGAIVGFVTKLLFRAPRVFFQDHVYWAVPVDYAVKVPLQNVTHN